jgi:hypothetical protein
MGQVRGGRTLHDLPTEADFKNEFSEMLAKRKKKAESHTRGPGKAGATQAAGRGGGAEGGEKSAGAKLSEKEVLQAKRRAEAKAGKGKGKGANKA